MEQIFKTWKKATYFEGKFKLRDKNENWASPIDFPTVFTAYGAGIKSGNWQSCTSINTPNYVIDNYFDTIGNDKHNVMYTMWEYCKQLENTNWQDVESNKENILELLRLANNELCKLSTLN
tara:strand:+ start:741 stop:1103 length:363 start_codon:yes stop_codon:yes gene_type:complete